MNPDLPLNTRLKAAIEAAELVHPRLSAQAVAHVNGDFAMQLDRAIAASDAAKRDEHARIREEVRAEMEGKLIEAKPVEGSTLGPSPQEVSAAHMRRRL